ncbi:MAG TPA: helix-turn-helix transcriptional regulator [Gemmataceae bacterium]|nr:helix-turn-helix transcriptional regulator [Gemmataceae bacterium]
MDKSLDRRFGDALRSLREASGKTQEDFSIGRTYLSELERGLKTLTLETIVKLAEELGTTPARVVELATSSPPPAGQAGNTALPMILNEALASASAHSGGNATPSFADSTPLLAVGTAARAAGIELPELLAESALGAFRRAEGRNPRHRRRQLRFLVADRRSPPTLEYAQDNETPWSFTAESARRAVEQANLTLELADDVLGMNGIPFYELVGTRNLGSFVGAVYGYSLQREMPDRLMVNGHQDGYPDLCALTAEGKQYVERLRAEGMETAKKSWALYPYGGIEIKTTCGAVPAPTRTRRKPGIGDQRSNMLTGADWKAHHRETNRLLGLFWDFIDRVPTVIGLFYRNDLTEADWGEVVVPTAGGVAVEVEDVEEGMDGEVVVEMAVGTAGEKSAEAKKGKEEKKRKGRTTSVSIMTGSAVKKMGKGWVVLPSDPELLAALSKPRIFDLGLNDVDPLTSNLPAAARDVLLELDRERQSQEQLVVAKVALKPRGRRKR